MAPQRPPHIADHHGAWLEIERTPRSALRRVLVLATLVLVSPTYILAKDLPASVRIEYRQLVDETPITHSGESVGEVLDKLSQDGSSKVPSRQALTSLVEPFLEPLAFVLNDTLTQLDQSALRPDLIDIGNLFPSGAPEPAWADIVRSRHVYMLSDGAGYVRVFLQGHDAKTAYDLAYPFLRHPLAWILDSLPPGRSLEVEVFAYDNDLATCTFTLFTQSLRRKLHDQPPPPRGTIPLDMAGLEDFFNRGRVLVGAALMPGGGLTLIGTQTQNPPELAGHPVGLSDLAVAYRAVAFAGNQDPYVSLDRASSPALVNVNFGGRLQDTELGWVTLLADMRFKTIGDSLDPITLKPDDATIRQVLPDFQTMAQRMAGMEEAQDIKTESTRLWFYPNNVSLQISQDGTELWINSPRFTAAAEREAATSAEGKLLETKTPPWTQQTIDHLNRHYDVIANIYSELRDLDNVARLLALSTWLHNIKLDGRTHLDLDSLLGVELPSAPTPRQRAQMVVSHLAWKTPEGDQRFKTFDCAPAFETMLQLQTLFKPLLEGPDDLVDELVSMACLAAMKDDPTFETIKDIEDDEVSSFSVVAGGLDLDLKAATWDEATLGVSSTVGRLRNAKPNEIVKVAGFSAGLVRSQARTGAGIPPRQPPPPKPHFAGPEEPLHPVVAAGYVRRSEDRDHLILVKGEGERVERVHRIAESSWGDGDSHSIYFAENGTPDRFATFERGKGNTFHFTATESGTLVATKLDQALRPAGDDYSIALAGLRATNSPTTAWRYLASDTPVIAIDRLPTGEAMVAAFENGQPSVKIFKDGEVIRQTTGSDAVTAVRDATRAKITAFSGGRARLAYASVEGESLMIDIAGRQRVTITAEDWLTQLTGTSSPLDAIIEAATNAGEQIVFVRDAFAARPRRVGGAVEDLSFDATSFVAFLQNRHPQAKIRLDDPSPQLARRLDIAVRIAGPADIGLAVPPGQAQIDDRGLLRRIRGLIRTSGITPIETPADLQKVSSVVVVSAHNERALFDYLTSLGEHASQGNSPLQGKLLILNTCFEPGNPNMINELIARYDLAGVYYPTETIDSQAVQRVLTELVNLAAELVKTGDTADPIQLFGKAIEKVLDSDAPQSLKSKVSKLRSAVFQVSAIEHQFISQGVV